MTADLEFFFDPVCPFCWATSRWVREVQRLRRLEVEWRFISLKLLNEDGYEDKPPQYPDVHQRGLEMLRVCAAVREEEGPDVIGELYKAMGDAVWEAEPAGPAFEDVLEDVAGGRDLGAILASVGLPPAYADAADDDRWDSVLRTERDEALDRAGGDVGTPILSFDPPDGPAFFGPVISEPPTGDEAVELWEAIETLAHWDGFAELKRSLRDFPETGTAALLRDPAARTAS
ncbi:MAG: DsbA family protein [Actinomycetota bacterium]|nr:DsbA family protein [Actinomycetota bacterium]